MTKARPYRRLNLQSRWRYRGPSENEFNVIFFNWNTSFLVYNIFLSWFKRTRFWLIWWLDANFDPLDLEFYHIAVGTYRTGATYSNIAMLKSDIGATVYPKKYAHGFCFAVLCCGYIFTDFPISIRLTSLALWQSNDCPSASKATLMNRDKYFMWIHYERLHNHNKAKHNKTVCIFLGIYCNHEKNVACQWHGIIICDIDIRNAVRFREKHVQGPVSI